MEKYVQYPKAQLKYMENKYFNKLYEFQSDNEIMNVIQLDNDDIIVLKYEEEEKYIFFIYILKDRNYFLFQTIKEDRNRYRRQFIFSGFHSYLKKYKVEMIKRILRNRFIVTSNYGFKIYSLNENHKYSLILLETHLSGIKFIYEIDENNFIFCTENHVPAYYDIKSYNSYLIEKIKLISIEKDQTDKKLSQINIESLKFSYNAEVLHEITYYRENIFSDYIILKKKYLIFIAYTEIFILDLIKEIKYKVLTDKIKNLDIDRDIKKWNDNEFILIQKKKISLFELKEIIQNEKKEIELKFIGYSIISNSIKNLINIGEEKRFYKKEKDYILFY